MRASLLLLAIGAPFADIYLLFVIGSHVGAWPVIAFVLLSAIAGGRLARREGRRVLADLEAARRADETPREGLLSAGLLALAGALLIVPGAVSTLAGVTLLIPAVRRLLGRYVRGWVERRLAVGAPHVIDIGDDGRPIR